jgi:ribosome-binding factor A
MSRRTERVASFIQQELAMIIMRELDDPRLTGLPSITRVKVSEDLATADVFVTVMGTEGKQTAALNALKHSAGMMRSRLAEMMELRQVPYLKFRIDEELKKEREVLDLLRKIQEENEAKGTPQAEKDEGGTMKDQ